MRTANVCVLNSRDWAVCTLNLASCYTRNKLVLMLNIQQILFIFNLVFQINFQAVFHCVCAKNLMRNVENYKQNASFYLRPLRLTT